MLSSCMEHILTKDALYLLSYISMPRTGNNDIIHNLFWFGKGEFTFFLKMLRVSLNAEETVTVFPALFFYPKAGGRRLKH
jgi:hypothetical protein